MAYQVPGFLLLLSTLIGAIVTLAAPSDRLWMVAAVTSTVVTLAMVVSYVSLSASMPL